MSQRMTAAVVHEFGAPLKIEEVAVPTPGPGQVRVLVMANGVCHTDLHAAEGDWPVKPNLPFIPGNEAVGFVDELGAGVTSLKKGDRFVVSGRGQGVDFDAVKGAVNSIDLGKIESIK